VTRNWAKNRLWAKDFPRGSGRGEGVEGGGKGESIEKEVRQVRNSLGRAEVS